MIYQVLESVEYCSVSSEFFVGGEEGRNILEMDSADSRTAL